MPDRIAYVPLETFPEAAADPAILSALGIAWTDRIMSLGVNASRKPH